MRQFFRCLLPSLFITSVLAFLVACDWEGGGDNDFNTSSGDGSNVSGFYEGILSGGLAVNNDADIRRLVLQQSGQSVEVTDSNGSTYRGSVSLSTSTQDNTPVELVLAEGEAGDIVGTNLFTYQIGFEGRDNRSGTWVNFTGVIEISDTSVVVGFVFNENGIITDVITQETTLIQLKGTWVESDGSASAVYAQVAPTTIINPVSVDPVQVIDPITGAPGFPTATPTPIPIP